MKLTRSEAAKHSISLRTDRADHVPPIERDRVQLQQVLLNLILNAIEENSGIDNDTRDLLIGTVEVEPNGVLVAARVSGPGLNPDSIEHLFENFYTTKLGGLGMGLPICRSIVEGARGRPSASANARRGAVFKFVLPTMQERTAPPSPSVQSRPRDIHEQGSTCAAQRRE